MTFTSVHFTTSHLLKLSRTLQGSLFRDRASSLPSPAPPSVSPPSYFLSLLGFPPIPKSKFNEKSDKIQKQRRRVKADKLVRLHLCLHFFSVNRFIHTNFLDSIYMHEYRIIFLFLLCVTGSRFTHHTSTASNSFPNVPVLVDDF